MGINISIESFVAPEKAPHKYADLVKQLIEAGADKVATAEFATEAEAKEFLAEVQAAARDQDRSGVKRAFTEVGEGKAKVYRISVGVRSRITRQRKPAE